MGKDHLPGASHGTYQSYIIGFLLSAILTVIPFWLVMEPSFSRFHIMVSIIFLAVVQLLVQLHYFLHLNKSPKQRWNLVSLIYTVILVVFVVIGSLWIMYNLDQNMMMSPP